MRATRNHELWAKAWQLVPMVLRVARTNLTSDSGSPQNFGISQGSRAQLCILGNPHHFESIFELSYFRLMQPKLGLVSVFYSEKRDPVVFFLGFWSFWKWFFPIFLLLNLSHVLYMYRCWQAWLCNPSPSVFVNLFKLLLCCQTVNYSGKNHHKPNLNEFCQVQTMTKKLRVY